MIETKPCDLEAIAARVANATPGPWWIIEEDSIRRTVRGNGPNLSGVIASLRVDWWIRARARAEQSSNVNFIAHARTDAESLLAEVTRLRAQVVRAASVRSDGVTLVLNFDNYGRQRDALLALTATTPAEG